MHKQFKYRGDVTTQIVRPRPELDGYPRKVDYKALCAKLMEKKYDVRNCTN